MIPQEQKITIIGAGPAGCAASIFLSKSKIPHTIIDKAVFPRDKVCGDALSGKSVMVLKKIGEQIIPELSADNNRFTPSWGVKFAAPNGSYIDIPFKSGKNQVKLTEPAGFISKRYDADYYLLKKLDPQYANLIQDAELMDVERVNGSINLKINSSGQTFNLKTELVISAEGERSKIARKLGGIQKEPDHFCAGVRAYYTGVTGFHEQNFIELHFLKELLPGYLWIFPLPNGYANVGAGMLSKSVSDKKVDLKKAMLYAIENNPTIKDRFKGAVMEGKIAGWGLPLGSKKRKISGDNFLLTGDAGSLIDPFTGEGIGNALLSGMIAAQVAEKAYQQNKYTNDILQEYDQLVYSKVWSELKLSRTLQKLSQYPWLVNYVIGKANKNSTLRETISCMFDDLDLRKRFSDPLFYLKLLFN